MVSLVKNRVIYFMESKDLKRILNVLWVNNFENKRPIADN